MMIKTVFSFLLMCMIKPIYAQYDSKIYNQYVDFNDARYKDQPNIALQKADSILNSPEKLPAKTQINFYRSLAKLYEDQSQPEKAVLYNEKVIAAVPDYYVSHRALGYLYKQFADVLEENMKQIQNDSSTGKNYKTDYFKLIKTALPHLEKAEACDHDDDTLSLIKSLYKKLDDQKGLASLDNRLKTLKVHCIDLLTD